MALPSTPTTLPKKKKPLVDLDMLADSRLSTPASSKTAVDEVAKPMADAARQGKAGTTSPRKVTTDPRQGALKPADPLDDLAAERMAASDDIDASNARQQMDARSRAGLVAARCLALG